MAKNKFVWENERTRTRKFDEGEFVIEEVFKWRNKKGKQFAWQICWNPLFDLEWVKNDYGGYTRKSFLEEHGEDGVLAIWSYCRAGYMTKLWWKIKDTLGSN